MKFMDRHLIKLKSAYHNLALPMENFVVFGAEWTNESVIFIQSVWSNLPQMIMKRKLLSITVGEVDTLDWSVLVNKE